MLLYYGNIVSMPKLPEWMRIKHRKSSEQNKIRSLLSNNKIHTVCESAKCPNRGECFSQKTVTFMILGDTKY
jgi:lipoyl synthase